MKKIRAGIIGLGVGERHINGYMSHPDCEVVALCDFNEDVLQQCKNRYPGLLTYKNADNLLNKPDIDVVSIASYDNYHGDQVAQALLKNKHVFVEKPLCLFESEAEKIRLILNENVNLNLSSNLPLRTVPMFKWLKKKIAEGAFGNVFYIEADYLWGRIYKLINGWRGELPFYSIVYGASIHMIDLICWLMPFDKIIEVQGYGNQMVTQNTDFNFNDFSVLLFKFSSGLIAKVSANSGCAHPHFHKVAIYGTKATFFNDINGGTLVRQDGDITTQETINEEYPGTQKSDILNSFVDSIIDPDKKPIVTSKEVFSTMEICFAAEKAIQSNTAVQVNYS